MIGPLSFSPIFLILLLIVMTIYARRIGGKAVIAILSTSLIGLSLGFSHMIHGARPIQLIYINHITSADQVQSLRLLARKLADSQDGELSDNSDGWTFIHRPVVETEVEISSGSLRISNIAFAGKASIAFYGNEKSKEMQSLVRASMHELQEMGLETN